MHPSRPNLYASLIVAPSASSELDCFSPSCVSQEVIGVIDM
jgi:hypothetical protein